MLKFYWIWYPKLIKKIVLNMSNIDMLESLLVYIYIYKVNFIYVYIYIYVCVCVCVCMFEKKIFITVEQY